MSGKGEKPGGNLKEKKSGKREKEKKEPRVGLAQE
jgi:hypothetical protein